MYSLYSDTFYNNDVLVADEGYIKMLKMKHLYTEKTKNVPIEKRDEWVEQMDSVLLAVLAKLKGEEITFMVARGSHEIRKGKVVSVNKRIIHLWEGYHKRRLNMKNLIVYHDAVYAAMSCL